MAPTVSDQSGLDESTTAAVTILCNGSNDDWSPDAQFTFGFGLNEELLCR
jgi:hypothetical protein